MKIRLKILKHITNQCTSKEISFIFYIAQFQNENGQVKGIFYKDVCEVLHISVPKFYQIIHSLEQKHIINTNYNNNAYGLWEFTIVGNFMTKAAFKKGYLNVNYSIFHSDDFINASKSIKIIIIKLIIMAQNRRKNVILTYNKILEWTQKSKQSLKYFISKLSEIFRLKQLANKIEIEIDRNFYKRDENECDIFNSHALVTMLVENNFAKRENPKYNQENLSEISKLIQQYNKININKVLLVIEDCLLNMGEFVPQYINSILSKIFWKTKSKKLA